MHPRTSRLRKRRDRPLRAVRPSRKVELWYRGQLHGVVAHMCALVDNEVHGQRGSWEYAVGDAGSFLPGRLISVGDVIVPGLTDALARAALRFGDILGRARVMAALAARRNLGEVDERLTAAIKRSVGVDLRAALSDHSPSPDGMPSIAEAMAEAASANVALIKSIPEQYFGELAATVSEAFAAGMRWEGLIAKIKERGDVADGRAWVIARDQTSKMNAAFNEVRQVGLGIEEYDWSGALDARERPSHRRMEGVRCRWDAPPEVDGERVHPGEAILCRCAALPRVNLDFINRGGGLFGGVAPEQEREAA